MDSDFDVDESAWNQEEDGEKQLQLMEQQKKKKQWLKPTKPKVRYSYICLLRFQRTASTCCYGHLLDCLMFPD